MKLDDGRLTFVAQQEVTALDAIHKAALVKAACAGRVTEGVGTCISIHAPTWGATGAVLCRFALTLFQSTHPRGVRPSLTATSAGEWLFQSTHPRGVRQVTGISERDIMSFQSTHPRGVRHARAEGGSHEASISIHAPTWGATFGGRHRRKLAGISIHAPTWGATTL